MIVYLTTDLINGKKYIGKDEANNPNYLGSGTLLKPRLKKYGKESFKKEILEHCTSREELNEREIYWIEYYDAVNSKDFYNLAEGGQGGLGNFAHFTEKDLDEFKEKCMTRKGVKNTKEHIDKVVAKLRKPVLEYDRSGSLINVFPSIKDAAEFHGITEIVIIKAIKNNGLANNQMWRYKECEDYPSTIEPYVWKNGSAKMIDLILENGEVEMTLISATEVAKELNVSKSRVYSYIKSGKLINDKYYLKYSKY